MNRKPLPCCILLTALAAGATLALPAAASAEPGQAKPGKVNTAPVREARERADADARLLREEVQARETHTERDTERVRDEAARARGETTAAEAHERHQESREIKEEWRENKTASESPPKNKKPWWKFWGDE